MVDSSSKVLLPDFYGNNGVYWRYIHQTSRTKNVSYQSLAPLIKNYFSLIASAEKKNRFFSELVFQSFMVYACKLPAVFFFFFFFASLTFRRVKRTKELFKSEAWVTRLRVLFNSRALGETRMGVT